MKKFNQTVVLYDGAHIARGMNGVTKVPRKRPNNRNYKEWFDWPDLYDQALRQENEARRVAEEGDRVFVTLGDGDGYEVEIRSVTKAEDDGSARLF